MTALYLEFPRPISVQIPPKNNCQFRPENSATVNFPAEDRRKSLFQMKVGSENGEIKMSRRAVTVGNEAGQQTN